MGEFLHRHGNNSGGGERRCNHANCEQPTCSFHGITSSPPVKVVMSSLLARKVTVRAPRAAVGSTVASKATPGVLSFAVTERMLVMVMSAGPLIVTVMLPSSPGPKISTFMLLPREMVPPTSEAEPPLPSALTPKTCALGGVTAPGEATLISIPATGAEATLTTTG